MNIRDDLIKAKGLIDTPEKWRQDGSYGYATECLCAMGAVGTVAFGVDELASARDALVAALPDEQKGQTGWSVVAFNDDPATTHADVMALFDRAIASLPVSP